MRTQLYVMVDVYRMERSFRGLMIAITVNRRTDNGARSYHT